MFSVSLFISRTAILVYEGEYIPTVNSEIKDLQICLNFKGYAK